MADKAAERRHRGGRRVLRRQRRKSILLERVRLVWGWSAHLGNLGGGTDGCQGQKGVKVRGSQVGADTVAADGVCRLGKAGAFYVSAQLTQIRQQSATNHGRQCATSPSISVSPSLSFADSLLSPPPTTFSLPPFVHSRQLSSHMPHLVSPSSSPTSLPLQGPHNMQTDSYHNAYPTSIRISRDLSSSSHDQDLVDHESLSTLTLTEDSNLAEIAPWALNGSEPVRISSQLSPRTGGHGCLRTGC